MVTYEKITAILIIALVAALTIAFQALRVVDVLASVTEIWIWIAAVLLGIAANLLTRGVSIGNHQKTEPAKPAGPVQIESGGVTKSGEQYVVTSKALAGVDFYPSREELPSLKRVLERAKAEIFLLGFSLETVGTQNRDTIRSLLLSGVRIIFLVLSPTSSLVNPVEEAFSAASIAKAIERVVDELNNIRSGLPVSNRNLLEIRTHDLVPVHNIIAVDPNSDNGLIRAETYLYGQSSRSWISVDVLKKENPELFMKYWNSYKFVFDRSKPLST
jgi:hypothetical protein